MVHKLLSANERRRIPIELLGNVSWVNREWSGVGCYPRAVVTLCYPRVEHSLSLALALARSLSLALSLKCYPRAVLTLQPSLQVLQMHHAGVAVTMQWREEVQRWALLQQD